MVVSRGPVKQQQQPFQHLRSKHHWQPTQQPSCLPNEQYVNTYILYQTSVECRSNNIKQQQHQTTTQVQFRNLNDGGQQRPRQTAKQQPFQHSKIKTPLTTNTTAVLSPQWIIHKHLQTVSNKRRMPQQQHQTTTTANNHTHKYNLEYMYIYM